MAKLLPLVISLLLPLSILSAKMKIKKTQRLSRHILNGYDATVRPTEGGNVTVLTLNIMLNDIISMQEGTLEAILKSGVWVYMQWTDHRLSWENTQYTQEAMYVQPRQIWRPDLTLFNSLDPKLRRDESAMVTLQRDGTVKHVVPMWLVVHCYRPRMPNATWECPFKLGSWIYNAYLLDIYIRGDGLDLSGYSNKVWGITGNESKRRIINRKCCREPWAQVVYTLRVVRR